MGTGDKARSPVPPISDLSCLGTVYAAVARQLSI